MVRRFSNRLFGGVCAGLASISPFSPAVWRWLFVILTLLTSGAAALAYMLLWWLLPLENPLEDNRSNPAGIFAIALALAIIIGWFVRDSLAEALGADLYWPLAAMALALAFLFRQFRSARVQSNIILGLVALAIPLFAIASGLGALPEGIYDLALRAWPALLVFLGLMLLLRPRTRSASFFALLVSLVLVAGITAFAFSNRINEQRTENTVTAEEIVSEGITTLQININMLDTDVVVFGRSDDQRMIEASFVGSEASEVTPSYLEDGTGSGTFTIQETKPTAFPSLDEIGRGELQITLPTNAAIAVTLVTQNGTVNFDAAILELERLKMTLENGDAIVTLPEYQPRSPSVEADPGELTVGNGDLRVRVPAAVGGRFVLNQTSNSQPTTLEEDFDDLLYALELRLNEWVLVSRTYDDTDIQITYGINVPNGNFRLDVIDAAGTASDSDSD
ncbi:MAG: PspC domain-containing protein [Anaerolineae bacterium]|nr:PspC domain-containing protein [Anaerolineae bacterium]